MSILNRGTSAIAFLLLFTCGASAQTGAFIAGVVTRDTGEPMAGAAGVIEELKREIRTGADGAYRFDTEMGRSFKPVYSVAF